MFHVHMTSVVVVTPSGQSQKRIRRVQGTPADAPELRPPYFYFYLGKVDDLESLFIGSDEDSLQTYQYVGNEDKALLIYQEQSVRFACLLLIITELADWDEQRQHYLTLPLPRNYLYWSTRYGT